VIFANPVYIYIYIFIYTYIYIHRVGPRDEERTLAMEACIVPFAFIWAYPGSSVWHP